MKLTHLLQRIIFPIIGLLGLFVVMVLVINLSIFDEELNPEIVELMQPKPMSQKPGNAFYAIWGLSSADNKDMIETGIQLIERHADNRKNKHIDDLTEDDYLEISGGNNLDVGWLDHFDFCTAVRNSDCVVKLVNQLKDKPLIDDRLERMLDRYNQIIKMPYFEHYNLITMNSPMPPYGALVELRQIKLARAFNTNDPQTFIDALSDDLKFWKLLLREGSTLIDKMVAVASIWGDIQAISNFIAVNEINQTDINEMDRVNFHKLLVSLTTDELDISESLITEAIGLYNSLDEFDPAELAEALDMQAWPISLLLQKNATNNFHYQHVAKQNLLLAKLPVNDFYSLVKNNQDSDNSKIEFDYSMNSLYNMAGKMLLPISTWKVSDYIARVHDLNNTITLVRLQLELKGVPNEQIQSAINSSKSKNQYTNQPMNFNAEKNELSFECLTKNSICSISL